MSLHTVARLAGVSASTVSRVINQHPNVAADTVESVRRAMRELSFTPVMRRSSVRNRAQFVSKAGSFAFIVFGTSGSQPTAAFEELLRGVSDQSSKHNINLIFGFVSDPAQLPPRIAERRVDGLLLHGERPTGAVKSRLESLPTVWLMANPHRPAWGDQVMPDNSAIGAMAAKYLLQRGHRRLAYLGTRASWSLELRSLAFAHAASEAGVHADVLEAPEPQTGDFWQREGLDSAASVLASRLATLAQAPTGLFIAEDRLVPMVDAAMKALRAAHNGDSRGGSSGGGDGVGNGNVYPHGAVDIISCNNERAHFNRLNFIPATIDIRAEAIGRLGVERLIWRLSNSDIPERIRCMVEPHLVEAGMNAQLTQPALPLRSLDPEKY